MHVHAMRMVGLVAVSVLAGAACGGDSAELVGVFDAGGAEAVVHPRSGEVPEVDGLAPAVTTEQGEFPLLLSQCFDTKRLNEDLIIEYVAERQWRGEGVLFDDSRELSLDLDDFKLDDDGCFEIEVAGASVPGEVITQVEELGAPSLVSVKMTIHLKDPVTTGEQQFEPFWIVPTS